MRTRTRTVPISLGDATITITAPDDYLIFREYSREGEGEVIVRKMKSPEESLVVKNKDGRKL